MCVGSPGERVVRDQVCPSQTRVPTLGHGIRGGDASVDGGEEFMNRQTVDDKNDFWSCSSFTDVESVRATWNTLSTVEEGKVVHGFGYHNNAHWLDQGRRVAQN